MPEALTHGSLFTGMGGLDIAIAEVFGAETAWVSDVDPGANLILAHRYPHAPNLGDITAVDWASVEPVDIISGGSPCQDLSHAGKRAGMTDGTRSNLWVAMREAIAVLRPRLVVWENVRGAYSASADSGLEHCPGCMGSPGDGGPALRALGRVLGDLSDLGYDAVWVGLRAADVGACHGRFRVFVVAYPRGEAVGLWAGLCSGVSSGLGWGRPDDGSVQARVLPTPTVRDVKGHNQRRDDTCLTGALLPTPRASDGEKGGPNQRGSSGDLMLPSAVALLPTPSAADGLGGHEARGGARGAERLLPGIAKDHHHGRLLPTPSASNPNDDEDLTTWQDRRARVKETAGNGNGFGTPLGVAVRLLPTVKATNNENRPSPGFDNGGEMFYHILRENRWGVYAEAIARQERTFGRPAPEPTQPGKHGAPRLSAAFCEWLMGLPAGWITDVPGITRNEALKACGNGVVPQQAAAALRYALPLLLGGAS